MLFDRPRPELTGVAEVFTASFPSGHATVSAVVFLTIGAMLAAASPERRLQWFLSRGGNRAHRAGRGEPDLPRCPLPHRCAGGLVAGRCLGAALHHGRALSEGAGGVCLERRRLQLVPSPLVGDEGYLSADSVAPRFARSALHSVARPPHPGFAHLLPQGEKGHSLTLPALGSGRSVQSSPSGSASSGQIGRARRLNGSSDQLGLLVPGVRDETAGPECWW